MNAENVNDYYGVLGVQNTATISEIHKAYWQLASHRHPDKGGSHEEMVRLVEAWNILSEPYKRARYDQLLKYRLDGLHSRRFNDDVREARKQAKDAAGRSWAEFEAIYQKAFYTFNQDFYGEEVDGKASGPYSPLLMPKGITSRGDEAANSHSPGNTSNRTTGGAMFGHIINTLILVAALGAAFVYYHNYSGVGRFVPLGQQNAASVLILDTTTGAVYSVEKRAGELSTPWKETVPPVPREKKWPR